MAEETTVNDSYGREVVFDQMEQGQTDILGIQDWSKLDETKFAYASSYSITTTYVNPDILFKPGDKIHIIQAATDKYFYVLLVDNNTVWLVSSVETTVANAAITSIYISNRTAPDGFPEYFATATADGSRISGSGTLSFSGTFSVLDNFTMVSNKVFVRMDIQGTYTGSGAIIYARTNIKVPTSSGLSFVQYVPYVANKASSVAEDPGYGRVNFDSTNNYFEVDVSKMSGAVFNSTEINLIWSGMFELVYVP